MSGGQTHGPLIANNAVLEIATADADGGVVGVQYDAFGDDGVTAAAGTIVVEGTLNGVEWYAKAILPAAGGANVGSLAAPGLGSIFVYGAQRMRARITGGGGAHGVVVWLNLQEL